MKFNKCLLSTILLLCLVSTSTFAQESLFLTDVVATPQFFVSLLAGLLLAVGFQVLLTALSVAIGFTAIGNVQHQANRASSDDTKKDTNSNNDSDTPMGVKISSGVGIWTMITASIALFFAAMLAVKLSLIGNVAIGVTLGLVIWAAFFTTLAYLEVKSVSTLLGSLISTVLSGIKSSASAVQSMFQGSPYGKIEDIANQTVEKVRAELEDSVDLNQINKKIDEYVSRIEESGPDYDRVKKDMIGLLKDIRIEETTDTKGGNLDTETFIKLASEQPNLSKEDAKKLTNVFKDAKRAVDEGDTKEDQAKKVASQFTNKSEAEIDGYVQQIEDYLRSTDKEEVNPDAIRDDIERIIENPQNAQGIISNRAKQIDRSTWVALLEQNDRMDHDRAEKVVGYVEQAIDYVANKAGQAKENQQGTQATMEARTDQARVQANQQSGQTSSKAEEKVKNYLDGLGRPELQYESLKWDVEKIMHDPKVAPQVIRRRVEQFDRETLMALLTSNDRLSRQDIEKLSQRFDESKQRVLTRLDETERQTKIALERAKQEALHQAEATRQTAASAAWWLFATAVVSGVAAALGGWVAII